MNPTIKPISVVLKEARQGKGISLEEAYKATKVHPKILHALEEGTTLGLSHVYVKSYIKIYANYLGISRQELDKYFHVPINLKDRKVKLDVSSIAGKGERIHGLSGPVILPSPPFISGFLKKAAVVLAVFLVFLIIVKVFPKKVATAVRKDKSPVVISAFTNLNKEEKVKKATAEKESFAKIGDTLRLTIFTEEDNWMQIKTDGKVVFKRILKKGTSETWQAKDSFELWLANAGIIKLELNGKILPSIGRRGQLLKSVVINREGYTINK